MLSGSRSPCREVQNAPGSGVSDDEQLRRQLPAHHSFQRMISTLLLIGILVAIFVGYNIGGATTGPAFGPAVGAGAISKTAAGALMTIFFFVSPLHVQN